MTIKNNACYKNNPPALLFSKVQKIILTSTLIIDTKIVTLFEYKIIRFGVNRIVMTNLRK